MRFMFKILVLGESDLTFPYIVNALGGKGEDMGTYYEWFKEFKVFDNVCDLEIDVITDIISTNFDEIIPMVDGIVYILNPMKKEEFEFFEMLVDIIESVKRDIPMIILFYDRNGILPISTNKLLETVWQVYSDYEAFVNLFPDEFHQIIQCLSLSMISGDPPLNVETAWLRLPIIIRMANFYYEQGNNVKAAHALKKVATIADIYNKNEYYVYCEQTAYLFSRANLYLEASEIIKDVSQVKANNFKRLYVENLIREGNKLFNKKSFEMAARQYETAGQWTSIELKDKMLIQESFRLAINSWISACKNQEAFRVLERLDHEETISVLTDISDKIIDAADFLISANQLEKAKEELYLAINTYQKEDLFDQTEKFTAKLAQVLIKILEEQTKAKQIYEAKQTFDELENIWQSYDVNKTNLDHILEPLIREFIERLNFSMTSILINKLDSLELKKELTEYSSEIEERNKEKQKLEKEENLQRGIEIIKEFLTAEYEVIRKLNTGVLEKAKNKAELEDFLDAAELIKAQVNYLVDIGMKEVADQMLTNSLDYLVKGKHFEKFFEFYSELQKSMKKIYLKRIFPLLKEKLEELANFEELKKSKDFKEKSRIFKTINQRYRNVMLYEKSREISYLFIELIKNQALLIVQNNETKPAINTSLKLIKKVKNISNAYLNNEKITFDRIYKKIAEIYISLDDLSSAHVYNDKIENKEYKSEIHKKIAKMEASRSAIKSKKAEESLRGEILKEQISLIKKKARDARADKKNDLKQRGGLKRAFFKDPLELLKKQNYQEAYKAYKRAALRLNRIKKYNLAGTSFMVASLILMKQRKFDKLIKSFKSLEDEISESSKIFFETFPMVLIDYIISLKKIGDEAKLNAALSYIEYLPLFEEELGLLYDILGKERRTELKAGDDSTEVADAQKLKAKIKIISKKIENTKQDESKRKLMKSKYWIKPLDSLENEEYLNASMNYLDVVPPLMKKDFQKHAAIAIILGSFTLLKAKNIHFAYSTFQEQREQFDKELKNLPEISLAGYIFNAFEHNMDQIISFGMGKLTEELILFNPEIDFLRKIADIDIQKASEEDSSKKLSRKERADLKKLRVELDQTYGLLKQRKRDVKTEFTQFFRKRKAMRRRFYDDILSSLKQEDYTEAAAQYSELAHRFAKRKDTLLVSISIMLYAFCLLQTDFNYEEIGQKVDSYIKTLDIREGLINDTFVIKLLTFILNLRAYGITDYNSRIRTMLEDLPLFEEEKHLLKI
ncbi:MAG: hypothetical protein R6U96_11075 [Promethearchaeia archaeon]